MVDDRVSDRDRLEQMICNLLRNAINVTPKFGSINVELSVIIGENFSNACSAEVWIADAGIDIAAEFVPEVFDRSYHQHSSPSA